MADIDTRITQQHTLPHDDALIGDTAMIARVSTLPTFQNAGGSQGNAWR